jgi:two-component sensor histidine kinase/PAS domain-containing protein
MIDGIISRLSRRPRLVEYLVAVVLAGGAVLCRAALERIAPGLPYFVVLVPTVAIAGVFCGTLPAICAGAVCGILVVAFFLEKPLLAGTPLNSAQVGLLISLPACAAVLGAISILRRAAINSVEAEARLAEVFRQIPGAAAIIEGPDGRLLLRSTNSNLILDQSERPFEQTADLGAYGGLGADGTKLPAEDYPITRALKNGEVVSGERLRYRRTDGRLIDLEVYAGPVRSHDGKIRAAIGMAFDVSDRAKTERLLQESESRYRASAERLGAAIDAGALGLWELDVATRRVLLDANFASMLDLPCESIEMDQAELMKFVDPNDQPRAALIFEGQSAASGPEAGELQMQTAQNAERWFVTRGVLLPSAQTVVGIVSNVTERHQREEASRQALAERDLLVREADHRIKNSLQLTSSLLRLQIARTDDAALKVALESAVARVNSIASAHKALQYSSDLKSMDIDQVLHDLCGRLALLNPAVTVRCEATGGFWLNADEAIPLSLIANELMTNALHHAFPPGACGVVTLTLVADDELLRMTIADGGAGLPVSPLRPGLGTTVVRALAKQIGAAITTQSEPGRGTTVCVSMRLATGPELQCSPSPAMANDVG